MKTVIQKQVIYDILHDPNRQVAERLLRHRAGKLVSLYHNEKYDDHIYDEHYQQ